MWQLVAIITGVSKHYKSLKAARLLVCTKNNWGKIPTFPQTVTHCHQKFKASGEAGGLVKKCNRNGQESSHFSCFCLQKNPLQFNLRTVTNKQSANSCIHTKASSCAVSTHLLCSPGIELNGKARDRVKGRSRPVRVQRELGVVSRLSGSSLAGWGRVFAWGSGSDCKSNSGLFVDSRQPSEHTWITDCSAQRRTPGGANAKNEISHWKNKF